MDTSSPAITLDGQTAQGVLCAAKRRIDLTEISTVTLLKNTWGEIGMRTVLVAIVVLLLMSGSLGAQILIVEGGKYDPEYPVSNDTRSGALMCSQLDNLKINLAYMKARIFDSQPPVSGCWQ